MTLHLIHTKLSHHVPLEALPYCSELWNKYKFEFRLSKKRSTKLGDYKYDPSNKKHYVSVNKDLNKYNFLITYVHEVAHCVNVIENGRRSAPHGKEWKMMFRNLMLPLLNNDIFPDDLLRPLAKHMKTPKASSQSDHQLVLAIRKYDNHQNNRILLELSHGESFVFNKRAFKKIKTRRSRVVCEELKTGRNFLISAIAPVEFLER